MSRETVIIDGKKQHGVPCSYDGKCDSQGRMQPGEYYIVEWAGALYRVYWDGDAMHLPMRLDTEPE